jgi:hypothetical protein
LKGTLPHGFRFFERHSHRPDFSWESFYKKGLLSKRPKDRIGDLTNVEYVKPTKDPNRAKEEKSRIQELYETEKGDVGSKAP